MNYDSEIKVGKIKQTLADNIDGGADAGLPTCPHCGDEEPSFLGILHESTGPIFRCTACGWTYFEREGEEL